MRHGDADVAVSAGSLAVGGGGPFAMLAAVPSSRKLLLAVWEGREEVEALPAAFGSAVGWYAVNFRVRGWDTR